MTQGETLFGGRREVGVEMHGLAELLSGYKYSVGELMKRLWKLLINCITLYVRFCVQYGYN